MAHVRLIHWNASEALPRRQRLEAAGYEVVTDLPPGPELFRQVRSDPPAAFVIDLSRLPSQGRDIALSFRSFAATRRVPLVFVGGDPAKVAGVQTLLPDAVFTTWEDIATALTEAIAHPPSAPVTFESAFAAYSGRPLPAKLGIKDGSVVALIDAPPDFAQTLGSLPPGVRLSAAPGANSTLILCFVRSGRDLERAIAEVAPQVQTSSLWIIWPKKASGVVTDVSEAQVRQAGLAVGLVDFKIAAIDATWSGLLFRRRKGG